MAGGEDGGGQEGSTFLTKVKIFSHFPQLDRKKCTIYFFQDLPLHKFDLRFVTLQVRALRNQPARIVNLRETLITDAYLLYQVSLAQVVEKSTNVLCYQIDPQFQILTREVFPLLLETFYSKKVLFFKMDIFYFKFFYISRPTRPPPRTRTCSTR